MKRAPRHPLAVYRRKNGIGPSVAAEALSISRVSLYRIEKGEQHPSVPLIGRIVAFTGGEVTADALVTIHADKP